LANRIDVFAGFWQREDVQRRWTTTFIDSTLDRDD